MRGAAIAEVQTVVLLEPSSGALVAVVVAEFETRVAETRNSRSSPVSVVSTWAVDARCNATVRLVLINHARIACSRCCIQCPLIPWVAHTSGNNCCGCDADRPCVVGALIAAPLPCVPCLLFVRVRRTRDALVALGLDVASPAAVALAVARGCARFRPVFSRKVDPRG